MSNQRFKIYKAKTFQLAKTIVIKHHAIAKIINTGLLLKGYDSKNDPIESWKYYQNLAGAPHSTDPEIVIKSLEDGDQTDIVFNRENLKSRPTTWEEYQFDGRFYNDLIRKYPDEETRIYGVLYPIVRNDDTSIGISESVEKAVQAEDGQILYFDKNLVEEQETNLIPELQKWITNFLNRWYIPEYTVTDDHYFATMLGVMYSKLPEVIMNIRLSNCRTQFAHGFHIYEYLESKARLGKYIGVLTTKQKLWLYRNLQYIQNNAGKTSTFKSLIKALFTDRNLPIAYYNLRHNLGNQPEELVPTVEAYRTAINFRQVGSGKDVVDVDYLLEKEVYLSNRDSLRVDEESLLTNKLARHSLSNNEPTKVLESAAVDFADSVTYPLSEVLFYNWVYRISNDTYRSNVFLTNPTSGQRFSISVKEAYALFVYSYSFATTVDNNNQPIRLTLIPPFRVANIFHETPSTLAQLRSVVDKNVISDTDLQQILDTYPTIDPMYNSVESFRTGIDGIQKSMMALRNIYVSQEDYRHRGFLEFAVNLGYKDLVCDIYPSGSLYSNFFNTLGVDLDALNKTDHEKLYNEILSVCLGSDMENSTSIRTIQATMVAIMTQLSSYTIQILTTINTGKTYIEDAADLRYGNVRRHYTDSGNVVIPTVWSDVPSGHYNGSVVVKLVQQDTLHPTKYSVESSYKEKVGMQESSDRNTIDKIRIQIPSVRFWISDPETTDLGNLPVSEY